MSRYIDAESVKEKLGIAFYKAREWSENHQEGIAKAEIIIDQEPTVDVAPVVHAHWNKTCVLDIYQCSACKSAEKMDMSRYNYRVYLKRYCPNCGARMDEE